jgi:hypothetical protein
MIDPAKALAVLKEHVKTRSERGQSELDLSDPEDVMRGLQDAFNLSDSDADELSQEVWELM